MLPSSPEEATVDWQSTSTAMSSVRAGTSTVLTAEREPPYHYGQQKLHRCCWWEYQDWFLDQYNASSWSCKEHCTFEPTDHLNAIFLALSKGYQKLLLICNQFQIQKHPTRLHNTSYLCPLTFAKGALTNKEAACKALYKYHFYQFCIKAQWNTPFRISMHTLGT